MTHPALIERITRSLAYMLRHQPEEFELELDSLGFGQLDEVVRALNERLGESVEAADVKAAISSGDRPRYEIVDDRVRALYGHSIDVEPGETSKPPELLFVGLSSRDAKRAVQYGLRGGRRRFLHLALTIDDARETGRRTGREYSILTVHALDAWEDGTDFYDRQALYLAEQIPTDFLEITETRDDGQERFAGNGRGGDRGRGRGGRGRSEHGDSGGRREGGRSRTRDGGDRGRSRGPRDRDREAAPPRGDRGEGRRPSRDREPERGPRREGRPDRAAEPDRGAPQRERAPEQPRSRPDRKPAPAPTAGFGTGIFEEPKAKPAPKARKAPEPPAAAPQPKPAPEPAPAAAPEKATDESSGFGAGV